MAWWIANWSRKEIIRKPGCVGMTAIIQCTPKTNYARPRQTSRSFINRCHRSDHERSYSNRAQRLGDRRPACEDDRLRPGTIARARKKVGSAAGNTSICRLTASQRKTASACITTKPSTSGLKVSKRNSQVRANEDPFMLSGLLDVRRE